MNSHFLDINTEMFTDEMMEYLDWLRNNSLGGEDGYR